MDSQDLVAYLAQKGFKVRSVSMVDSLANTLEKRPAETSKNLPIIRTPISKGITGMPKCRQCFKSFANNIALRNHAKMAHFETIDDELLKLDANLGDETLDGDQMESSMPVGSQYQVVDSSFIGDSTGVETAEEISYVIIKTPSLSNVSYSGPNRKARKVETRPRKPYESRIKHDMKDVKVVEFGGPFRCVQCEDTFNECCEYSQHFHSMHSKRRRLTRCQICEKRFDHDLDVSRLAALSGGDGEVTAPSVSLTCPVCSEAFTSAALLQHHHKAQHSKVKPFQCNLCSKTFSQGAGLSQHLKIHSGVRPYACQVCHKSFTQKGGLDQHARTHSPRRPYACVVCARGFRQSAHLSQHMRTHTRLQPFRCGLCERSFKQSTHLNFHLRTHHSQTD